MAQPRKYTTDAERYKAYRERKRERVEEMSRELKLLKPAKAKRNATLARDLRPELRELAREMAKRRLKAKGQRAELRELLDYIEGELTRLAG